MNDYRIDDYQTERSNALSVLREETVNGITVGLFHMKNHGANRYKIVTSNGGTQTAKTDRFIYADFDAWVRSICRKQGTGELVAAVAVALDAIEDDLSADATIAANAAYLAGR